MRPPNFYLHFSEILFVHFTGRVPIPVTRPTLTLIFYLQKPHGYHLDVFVLAVLIMVCSILGLPWFVAATVRSVTHVRSLLKESEVKIPGEKTQIVGTRYVTYLNACCRHYSQPEEQLLERLLLIKATKR